MIYILNKMIYKLQNGGKIAKTIIKATKRAPVSSLDKIPIWKRIFPIIRTVQDDLTEMNKYHQLNVDEYNKTFGTNIQSIPFRTEFPINPVKILPRNEFETLININNSNNPNKNIENIGGYYSRTNDQVVLPNTAKSSAAYHEFEHMGQYGLTNPEVTRWRIEQLVDPEKTANMTDNAKAYFLSEEEFPVHLRQYGENLGIGIGDPYPGDIEFDKLIEENGIGGASTYVRRATSEEKRLMWRAMNGTLFASLPFVSTLFGIQKDKNGGIIKLQNASKPFESATAKSYFSGLKDYLLHQTKSFTPSLYKPTKGSNIQQQYYTRPGLKEEVVLNLFGGTDSNIKGPLGNYFFKDFDDAYNRLSLANESRTTSNGTLGKYGVSAGIDDRGRYISFIDTFDHVFIPGKGIPIYDRIYEDEIESLYNPNLSALNEGDWITRSPELKKRLKHKLNKGGVIKLQKAWTKVPRILRKAIKGFEETVDKTTFVPAQVKYYGPTMGKSYAAKTNPNLIDLDTWGRSEYDQLAKKYGYKDWREMILSDKGDYNEEYKQLIKDQIRRIQSDPQYSGKTIMVSNASLLKPDSGITFANTPVIPEQSIMATRNTARHPWESIEHGESWWNSLQAKGTPLRIDNRFVSDIEGSKELIHVPKITIPDVRTYHLIDSSMPIKKQGGILKAQSGTGLVGIPILRNLAKKGFELVAKRSNGAQTKSIPTIIGDVITGRDKSFYNINNSNGSNEIDTYLYGKPYNSEFIGDASIGPDYTNYINKNYPNKNIKTYNTHFGDTLYIDNKAKSLVEKQLNTGEVVGGSMGRYAHAPSYIVTTEEGRPYDAGGHLIKFGKDKNGNIVANMSDIYDFLPEDFNDKYDQTKNPSWTRNLANIIGTPFIVRQNNIPVVFKEIVPEYKTEKQKELGDFLSQWGNTYDLNLPLKLSDEQIDEIFDGKDYGDDILNFMVDKGYIKSVYKQGGILKAQKGTPGFVTPMTNQFTTKLMEILNKYLRKDQSEQKAVGTATWAYNKPSKIVKDGGDI